MPGTDSSRRNWGGRIPKFKPTSWQHSCPSHMDAGGAAPGCPNFLLAVPWADTAKPASTRAEVKEICRRGKQNKTRKKKRYQKAIKKLSKPGLSGAGRREGAGAGAAGTGWHLAAREPGKQQSTRPPPGPPPLLPGGADSGRLKGRRSGRTSPALCAAGGAESRVCSPQPPGPGASAAVGVSTREWGGGENAPPAASCRALFWGWRRGEKKCIQGEVW